MLYQLSYLTVETALLASQPALCHRPAQGFEVLGDLPLQRSSVLEATLAAQQAHELHFQHIPVALAPPTGRDRT